MVAMALASAQLSGSAASTATRPTDVTLRELADDATGTLTASFYAGHGRWRACLDPSCGAGNTDWGTDSLTGALYLRRLLAKDDSVLATLRDLEATEPHYEPCSGRRCRSWSDVPMWDAIAALRTYDATHDALALRNAEAAYAAVAGSDVYARGACPEIDYQRPRAEGGGLKTLETDANLVLAGALLARHAPRKDYLALAIRRYDAVRTWFLDQKVALYTVYVFDDGRRCKPLPHRFFASVNGRMIEAGLELARLTGAERYADEARATAHAVRALDDDRGIFTDLQAENDVVEPLVTAMAQLARDGDIFARDWIVRNAAAAAHCRRAADGAYGRFFDGPPPSVNTTVTAWQSNGGLALAIAAGALAPDARAETVDPWAAAPTQPVELARLPSTFAFTGSAIALRGTLGERCCEAGRARVFIDGRELINNTGIWQNKSSSGLSLPGTVLFAWRWPVSEHHTLRFEADTPNAKEGGAFLHVREVTIAP
jgi:hypothetical protein